MTKHLFLLFILLLSACTLPAQRASLTLDEAVLLAKEKSIASRQAVTRKETDYWRWQTYRSGLKPQLSLDGFLPSFTRSYIEVLQPDGTIAFQPVSNNSSSLNLSLSQSITKTGGTIFLQKQIKRFDDFDRRFTLYNGIPFAFGFSQPLFSFNPAKWDKQIEPLKYNESRQLYHESMENISLQVTGLYFDLLIAQVNLQIAEKNLSNTDTLYKIAQKRLELGKISQNDLLQLRLAVLNSKKDLASAKQAVEVAGLQLTTYIGYRSETKVDLVIPYQIREFEVDVKKALAEAFSHRSDATAFLRRTLEAERELDKAKAENGLNASLDMAVGLSNRGDNPADIYRNPQDYEYVEVRFNLPILDWGRSKSRTETARANLQLTQQSIEQEKNAFEQEIYTQVTLFEMLQEQVKLTAETDEIADNRYQIAQDRFILSDLSITDLGLAMQEKDAAKRDYIIALRDYWRVYYILRLFTLYDFELNQPIY